ncbi:hypothetical protein BDF22DRAFT_739189 [Syncephalis plumigaleata]|nr:hypothetical protein BDF22DRAFT_739189 [Syncephalis plumigaleata]
MLRKCRTIIDTRLYTKNNETYVGLGQRCGYINGEYFFCTKDMGFACDYKPSQSETVCLKPARVQLGKWSGTCIANSSQ